MEGGPPTIRPFFLVASRPRGCRLRSPRSSWASRSYGSPTRGRASECGCTRVHWVSFGALQCSSLLGGSESRHRRRAARKVACMLSELSMVKRLRSQQLRSRPPRVRGSGRIPTRMHGMLACMHAYMHAWLRKHSLLFPLRRDAASHTLSRKHSRQFFPQAHKHAEM